MEKRTVKPLSAYFRKHPYQGRAFIRGLMKRRYMEQPYQGGKLSDFTVYNDSDQEFSITVEYHNAIMKSCMRHARKACKRAVKRSMQRRPL